MFRRRIVEWWGWSSVVAPRRCQKACLRHVGDAMMPTHLMKTMKTPQRLESPLRQQWNTEIIVRPRRLRGTDSALQVLARLLRARAGC